MPNPSLLQALDAAQARHAEAAADLAPLLIEIALATVTDVLPDAEVLATRGEMNEDWLFTLRIQRVLDSNGRVLYDVSVGHDDRHVEETIETVDCEYLDLLLDVTGDDYLGNKVVSRRTA